MNTYEIRAIYNAHTLRVYQAYPPEVAIPALKAGRFVPPFKMERMTWIKPSFNWMMYRCGFGSKAGQEVVLGIDITREGFEWALVHSALSHFVPAVHTSEANWKAEVAASPVRIQWDPERDAHLNPIAEVRSLQVGLSREAVQKYVHEWIVGIEDVTPIAHQMAEVRAFDLASGVWPHQQERIYPIPEVLQQRICPEHSGR